MVLKRDSLAGMAREERGCGLPVWRSWTPHMLSSMFSLHPEEGRRFSKNFKQKGSGWVRIAAQRVLCGNDGD